MTITDTVEAGTPPPGPVGRVVRLLMGILVLRFLAINAVQFEGFVVPRPSSDLPARLLFGSLFAFVLFGEVVRRGFGPILARPAQMTLAAVLFGVMAIDLAWYGDWWGPPMGLLVFVVIMYTLAHLGVSFLVAAAFATPG